ncbi:hypothetical protein [Pseudomonas sp. PB103]|uniref:hypothetical protein n=1 Tax=Pseudomonas sp. PB103 TaxID=2494698 RepID=UPI0021151BF4|nr:hypothetical protein [Pseudomonas sp. PB103]
MLAPLEIERAAFDDFFSQWDAGTFEGQRLGQAFYNHFRLHRLTDQTPLSGLYAADGKKARKLIGALIGVEISAAHGDRPIAGN